MIPFPDPESIDEAVYRVLEAVPRGKVTSYGAVAALLGLSTARRPAAAMRRAPEGLPWWRMIRSDGSLPPGLLARAKPQWDAEGVAHDGLKAARTAVWHPEPHELERLEERVDELRAGSVEAE